MSQGQRTNCVREQWMTDLSLGSVEEWNKESLQVKILGLPTTETLKPLYCPISSVAWRVLEEVCKNMHTKQVQLLCN
jgi:hypothetical protein